MTSSDSVTAGRDDARVRDAEQLRSILTPLGAVRAANEERSIPEWTGGISSADGSVTSGGKRTDPFAAEKPLYTISAANVESHRHRLSEGTLAMLARYPDTYHIDVYETHRTAAAPQSVYDWTYKNAMRARIVESSGGPIPTGAYGGIPFPIPKTGVEAMWNHVLRWHGRSIQYDMRGVTISASGERTVVQNALFDHHHIYHQEDGSADTFNGDYYQWKMKLAEGNSITSGLVLFGTINVNEDLQRAWAYAPGNGQVREYQEPRADDPEQLGTGGVMLRDELGLFLGRLDRYNWQLVGKRELIIPYNSNRSLQPPLDSLLGQHHLNPEHVRWELHRVWVVDAMLAPGQSHVMHRSRYYLDEDTWNVVLCDRWNAQGALARTGWQLSMVIAEMPGTITVAFGVYNLVTAEWHATSLMNEGSTQVKVMSPYTQSYLTEGQENSLQKKMTAAPGPR